MMISTPVAPIQNPHNLNLPFRIPFRDHINLRRQQNTSMFALPQRTSASDRNYDHGFVHANSGGRGQGFYAQARSTQSAASQQLEIAAPEHMLRRKTPNGTLKDGYDGTPVEWASRPPVHKHQIRNHIGADIGIDQVLHRQSLSSNGTVPVANRYQLARDSSFPDPYGLKDYGGRDGNARANFHRGGQAQPMDSMLYQASPQATAFPAGYSNVPIALQPTWPRNIEPTASGPLMPYGPYWPDGAFVPYRPIAFRDSRFPHQLSQFNLNDPIETRHWQQQQQQQQQQSNQRPAFQEPSYSNPHETVSIKHEDRIEGNMGGITAFPYGDAPTELHVNFQTQAPSYLAQNLPFSGRRAFIKREPSMSHAMPQLRFKELAFAQAHRTYATLLSFVQQSRKQNHQSKQGQKGFPGVSLFPKAPKNTYGVEGTGIIRNNLGHEYRSPAHNSYYSAFSPLYPGQGASTANSVQCLIHEAQAALDLLKQLAEESNWTWTDAMLLGGCLAYGLNNLPEAIQWFQRVLQREPANVEAMSNLAAAFMTVNQKKDAERFWTEAVKLRPNFFEAVEHLVGLLCLEQRASDAINVIQHVENALRSSTQSVDRLARNGGHGYKSGLADTVGSPREGPHLMSSGYRSNPVENGRLIALIHAKGNMLYASGNIRAAAQAFEEAIMVAVGRVVDGIPGLIQRILASFASMVRSYTSPSRALSPWDSILLLPKIATQTVQLVFPNSSPLPGLGSVGEGQPRRAAIAVTSNCLLSLAKIYQDSMSSGSTALGPPSGASGVQDILALYYLSLSLQPSPSTANNVGILLAGVQQSASGTLPSHLVDPDLPDIPNVVPGTGVALALSYYQYGLQLDREHAHLYTNLGSLLKDLGQLDMAIKMYEEAVRCDGTFDIALANLANAVKDRGRISDAIGYYKRAVDANNDFAEAVCGLANALNSVCGWTGRGGVVSDDRRFDRWHVSDAGMLVDARESPPDGSGWIGRVVQIVNKQLLDGRSWGKNVVSEQEMWHLVYNAAIRSDADTTTLKDRIRSWAGNDHEGAKVVRWVERSTRRIAWQWYQDKYVRKQDKELDHYRRPQLPAALSIPNAPTVLPFHTFTCPLSASQIRQISQRNGLRISASTLKAPWLPPHVFMPPPPPAPVLNVGYVSSDFNNHPLAHLMQSVFGMHDQQKVKAFCYATTPGDKSTHRQKIEKEAPVFRDVSSWPVDRLVSQIVRDKIHILVNLNGYTRGARNEVFAARPAPIQMSFMGFAGTLGAEWCDYLLADETAVPVTTLRPNRNNVSLEDVAKDDNFGDKYGDWVYGENIIYTRDTFFCCDHRQSAPDAGEPQLSWSEELRRRRAMRKELFPQLPADAVILGNFNQLYKIEPTTFRTWLRILQAVPKAVLWLLRFPDLGETNLRAMADKWTTPDVSSRIIFTDVAPKHQHISRARVCDLFLDTPECNAHTTAADVLWSGTPLLTYPRYDFKMCSRMAASILKGAMPRGEEGEKAAHELTVFSDDEYEESAGRLARGLAEVLAGRKKTCRVLEMRKLLYEGRWSSPLFDTQRWTRDLEEAYQLAWSRWEKGEGGDIWL